MLHEDAFFFMGGGYLVNVEMSTRTGVGLILAKNYSTLRQHVYNNTCCLRNSRHTDIGVTKAYI